MRFLWTCTHACLCFFWRLFQIVSSTMDLDGSWGQGSSRRDFHFVTFQWPLAVQDGLLSKAARSTTCGLLLALLDTVVLQKIQLSPSTKAAKDLRAMIDWFDCTLPAVWYFWHSLASFALNCHSFQCRILVPLLGPLDFHFSHQTTFVPLSPCLRTGECAISEAIAIQALRIATRGSGGNSQLNYPPWNYLYRIIAPE